MNKEVIDIETNRGDGLARQTIHLYKEGTFIRAYNWSAWLCCRYLNGFKVNKRSYNGIDKPVAYIGFPETSISKWVKSPRLLEQVDEKHLVLVLDMAPADLDENAMRTMYESWYNDIPLQEQKSKVDKRIPAEVCATHPSSLTGVMQKVIAYPVESKSPIDCMLFLSEIKKELSSLI